MIRARTRSTHSKAHSQFPLAETLRIMDLRGLQALETIDPKPLAPWQEQSLVEIEIESDREKANESAATRRAMPGNTIFSDASGQQNQLGAAAAAVDEDLQASESRQVSIGSMEHWSVYAAELMAIYYAISLVYQMTRKNRSALGMGEQPATILSDSMSALQAIRNPFNGSGQRIIRATLQAASEMKARGTPIRLQRVPGHYDDPGSDEADRLAIPFNTFFRVKKGCIHKTILNDWKEEWTKSTNRQNSALIRARRLYGSLSRNQAYLLTQLRTGHSWLATYGKLHRFRDDDRCILRCPRDGSPCTGRLPTARRSATRTTEENRGRIQQHFKYARRRATR
jgi:ribonuclease HI